MSTWSELQTSVSKALMEPDQAPPAGVKRLKNGAVPVKRFNVYRNNVALSLINVLRQTFPVVEELVGKDFFDTMARHFSITHLPESPMMFQYGDKFPGFIKQYEPAQSLPYLKDVAQLEWTRNVSLYAKDQTSITIEQLAQFDQEQMPDVKFDLHASLQLIDSAWPIITIWQAHQGQGEQISLNQLPDQGQSAVVLRPALEVNVHQVDPITTYFIAQLQQGQTFGQAVEACVSKQTTFDISANLAGLFSIGAVTAVHL